LAVAQVKCASIDKKKHRVICCAHPSPLSATKTSTPFIGYGLRWRTWTTH
jgi:uracil DNA glycosylase